MQKITIIGNLGKDAEERFTKNQKKLVTFSIAVNNSSKKNTVWYSCYIWENNLPYFKGILRYLTKGSRFCVIGDLSNPTAYKDKNGELKVSLSVQVLSINFVGSSSIEDKEDKEDKEESGESSPEKDPQISFEF